MLRGLVFSLVESEATVVHACRSANISSKV